MRVHRVGRRRERGSSTGKSVGSGLSSYEGGGKETLSAIWGKKNGAYLKERAERGKTDLLYRQSGKGWEKRLFPNPRK